VVCPLTVRPAPSSSPVSIAPLTTVPIAACYSQVVPIAAPLPLEVSPDAAPAVPILVLPFAPSGPHRIPAVIPKQAPIAALPSVAPSATPSIGPSLVPAVVPSSTPIEARAQVEPSNVPAVEPIGATSSIPTCSGNPQDGCSDARAELNRLVQNSITAYESASTWGEFVAQCRDPKGDFHPEVKHLPHRAAHLLDTLQRSGATVGMKTEPWSHERKDETLRRGSHQSAMLHTDFLCDECVDMIHKGQWELLPARLVLDEKNLQLSPLGVVPQRDRQPRTICDYSFFFVNLDTIPLAP
jgi:hypothetical protein